jgi:hypothetical protein
MSPGNIVCILRTTGGLYETLWGGTPPEIYEENKVFF